MNISLREVNSDRVRALSDKFHIPLLMATVIDRRGIEGDELRFLFEDDVLYEYSPFLSDDVYTAVERINEAIDNNEKIGVFGDRDVDGITGAAILIRGFKKLGYSNVVYKIPTGDEPYGISEDTIRWVKESGVTLLITVDNGISAVGEIEKLERDGIDVIVTDHHIPSLTLPPAVSIIDPKIEGSGYPYSYLAGCAVASKLLYALFMSKTELFDSSIILLHAYPGNDTIRIEAVRLENLVEVKRIREEVLVGNKGQASLDRLYDFLGSSTPIGVFDKESELSLLKRAFPKSIDISLIELKGEFNKIIRVGNRSLFDFSKKSRGALYSKGSAELDTLVSLYRTYAIRSHESLSSGFDEFSELRAIGTIADLMPLSGENRLIVRQGLKKLSDKPIKSLVPLLSKLGLLVKPVSSRDVSFKLAPILNAAGRMGKAEVALELLLADSDEEIERISDDLFELNQERHRVEEELMGLIKPIAHSSYLENDEKLIVVENDKIPRGLTGAIANRLVSEYLTPVIVIAYMDDRLSGSMRSKDDFDSREFLSEFSDLFDDFGGHRNAAGFSMPLDKHDEFIDSLKERIKTYTPKEEKADETEVDLIITEKYMNDELWNIAECFEPYGNENPELKIYISGARIEECHTAGGNPKYLMGTVKYGTYGWPFAWFDCNDRAKYRVGTKVDIIFSPGVSYYRGEKRKQLNICSMDPIID